MIGFKDLLLDNKSAPIELLSFFDIALCMIQGSEVVQIDGDFAVFRTEGPLKNSQSLNVELFGLVALSLCIENCGKSRLIRGDFGMVLTKCPLPESNRSAREDLATGIFSAGMFQAAQIVINRG